MTKVLTKQEKITHLEGYISSIYNATRPLFEEDIEDVDEDVLDYWIDVLVSNPVALDVRTARDELFPKFEG